MDPVTSTIQPHSALRFGPLMDSGDSAHCLLSVYGWQKVHALFIFSIDGYHGTKLALRLDSLHGLLLLPRKTLFFISVAREIP